MVKDAYFENETVVTAEFFDVDAMKIVWHGNYVKFMEVARCAMLDRLGYGYKEMVKAPPRSRRSLPSSPT